MRHPLRALVALAATATVACTPTEIDPGTPDAGDRKPDAGVTLDGPALLGGLECDPLVPTQCGFPFPSNVYLVDDAEMPGGKRVDFARTAMPASKFIASCATPAPATLRSPSTAARGSSCWR